MSNVINYISGGKTGDFIHVLFVIKYHYKTFGKKGNLFISYGHGGDGFSYSLDKVYNDIKDLVLDQEYINSFSIYNNEKIDINLNLWRTSPFLYRGGWIDMLCDTYKIQPSSENWLSYSKDVKYQDLTIIHRSAHRHSPTFPWKEIVEKEKCLFVTTNPHEAHLFTAEYSVDSVIVNTISELALIINSAKKFVGNMSAPLSLAHALGKHRLVELIHTDDIHFMDDQKYLPNFWYIKHGEKEIPSEFFK
jgi:hypothetical protein